MRGQSRIEAFNETIAAAEARRRKAISEAYRVFNTKHSAAKRLHRSTYMAAYAAWRAIKSRRDAEGYEVTRQRRRSRRNINQAYLRLFLDDQLTLSTPTCPN